MNLKLSEIFKSKKVVIAVIAIVFFIIFGVACSSNSSSLDKIYDSYHKNAATCIEKYDGKEVSLKVRIVKIDSSLTSILVGPVKEDSILDNMSCSLKTEKLQKKAKKLKNGDVITVKGTIHLNEVLGILSIKMETTSIS